MYKRQVFLQEFMVLLLVMMRYIELLMIGKKEVLQILLMKLHQISKILAQYLDGPMHLDLVRRMMNSMMRLLILLLNPEELPFLLFKES